MEISLCINLTLHPIWILLNSFLLVIKKLKREKNVYIRNPFNSTLFTVRNRPTDQPPLKFIFSSPNPCRTFCLSQSTLWLPPVLATAWKPLTSSSPPGISTVVCQNGCHFVAAANPTFTFTINSWTLFDKPPKVPPPYFTWEIIEGVGVKMSNE